MKKEKENEFEEVEINCVGCGRKMRIIKRKGYDMEGTLCQRCGLGEKIERDSD